MLNWIHHYGFFAIHSNNAEIINYIEQNLGKPDDDLLMKCLEESIKCHHVNITNYFEINYFENEINYQDIFLICLKYYNFGFIQESNVEKSYYLDYIEYGYNYFVKLFLDFVGINKVTKIQPFNIPKKFFYKDEWEETIKVKFSNHIFLKIFKYNAFNL